MNVADRLNDLFAQAEADRRDREQREAPFRAAMAVLRSATPRVIVREGRTRPIYRSVRLADIRFVARHVQTFERLGVKGKQHRDVPDTVRIVDPTSSVHDVRVADIAAYIRRPSAKALARIEAAEEALRAAQVELKASRRAAFTYGKPVPLSTIKRTTAAREKIERAHGR